MNYYWSGDGADGAIFLTEPIYRMGQLFDFCPGDKLPCRFDAALALDDEDPRTWGRPKAVRPSSGIPFGLLGGETQDLPEVRDGLLEGSD
jgi:hypothetical protein